VLTPIYVWRRKSLHFRLLAREEGQSHFIYVWPRKSPHLRLLAREEGKRHLIVRALRLVSLHHQKKDRLPFLRFFGPSVTSIHFESAVEVNFYNSSGVAYPIVQS